MIDSRNYNTPFPVEPLSDYGDGGLYAVHIHDYFQDGRYEIINKLGFGGFSTVWVARDHHTNSNVSIKVIRADCSKTTQELHILQLIQKDATQHPGRKYLPTLLDFFYEGSSTQKILFLVLELLGPKVVDVIGYLPNQRFSPSSSSEFSRQLLLAIDYLHSHNIVHGDIYEGNVLFRLPENYKIDWNKVQLRDIWRHDGAPLEKGLPRHIVEPLEFRHQLSENSNDRELEDFCHIQLIDFSTSFLASEPLESIHTVAHMSPPELIFQIPPDKSIDIWNLAGTVFFFSTGHDLFETMMETHRYKYLPLIHRVIGESSAHWLLTAIFDAIQEGKWKDFSDFQFTGYDDYSTLEHELQGYYNIGYSRPDKALIKFLRKCLVVDPSKRATTTDLEHEEWIQNKDY